MTLTIAIFGAEGQLGCDLLEALSSHKTVAVPHADVDIADRAPVMDVLGKAKADWVINAAAMTDVDRCEDDDMNAWRINALGARHVADACAATGARLVHISTDYVFDGTKGRPYVENDRANPLNVYGITKLAGEFYVQNRCPKHYVVRSSGLYGTHPCRGKEGQNFVDTMLKLSKKKDGLRVVEDEFLTPTFTEDLAFQIRELMESKPAPGIYHATNSGECSWFDFAKKIFEISGNDANVEGISSVEWKAPARRPACSVLENAALKLAGIDSMPHWRDALQRYLSRKLGG